MATTTTPAAQGMVIGCLAAAGAVAVGNAIVEGHPPTFKQAAGFTFAALGLSTLSEFAPQLAASMAALILTSAVFVFGTPVFDAITTATTPTT